MLPVMEANFALNATELKLWTNCRLSSELWWSTRTITLSNGNELKTKWNSWMIEYRRHYIYDCTIE